MLSCQSEKLRSVAKLTQSKYGQSKRLAQRLNLEKSLINTTIINQSTRITTKAKPKFFKPKNTIDQAEFTTKWTKNKLMAVLT